MSRLDISIDKLRTMVDISVPESDFLHQVATEKLGIPECITIGA